MGDPSVSGGQGVMLADVGEWPVAAVVFMLLAGFFVWRYASLLLARQRDRHRGSLAERSLAACAAGLRAYASGHGGQLPLTLESLGTGWEADVVYRPVPRIDLDEKLILLHGRYPTHRLIEFPMLRAGRGVVFCSGRLRVVSEEAFDKLIGADNALRERLGLQPLPEE